MSGQLMHGRAGRVSVLIFALVALVSCIVSLSLTTGLFHGSLSDSFLTVSVGFFEAEFCEAGEVGCSPLAEGQFSCLRTDAMNNAGFATIGAVILSFCAVVVTGVEAISRSSTRATRCGMLVLLAASLGALFYAASRVRSVMNSPTDNVDNCAVLELFTMNSGPGYALLWVAQICIGVSLPLYFIAAACCDQPFDRVGPGATDDAPAAPQAPLLGSATGIIDGTPLPPPDVDDSVYAAAPTGYPGGSPAATPPESHHAESSPQEAAGRPDTIGTVAEPDNKADD